VDGGEERYPSSAVRGRIVFIGERRNKYATKQRSVGFEFGYLSIGKKR